MIGVTMFPRNIRTLRATLPLLVGFPVAGLLLPLLLLLMMMTAAPARAESSLHVHSGALACDAGQPADGLPEVPAADLERIRAALPAEATVKPKAPRKVLVFTLTRGFRHSSIPHGVAALRMMGEQTGAFEVTHSEDILMFLPGRLDAFDAIVFLNSTGEIFEDAPHRDALLNFIRAGKGIIGIHAASDACYRWDQYGRLIGGYFDGHPWNANDTVTIRPEDPDHPVVKRAFNGEPLTLTEEIYQIRAPYSRDLLRVLVTLDPTRTDMTKAGIRRTDGDFPISWVQTYEGGRVFYTSLGHREDIYWNPKILQHYLDGIQYALGDLDADATPSAQLHLNAEEAVGMVIPRPVREALASLPNHEFGDSRYLLSLISDHVHASTGAAEQQQRAIEQALIGVLESREASVDAKSFVCRQLAVVGSSAAVIPLISKVADPELRHLAVAALAVNPSREAEEALLVALAQIPVGDPAAQALVLHALVDRRSAEVVEMLPRIAGRDDARADVLIAAARAWGAFGGPQAVDALLRLHAIGEERQDPMLMQAATDAMINVGMRLIDGSSEADREAVLRTGRWLTAASQPTQVQMAGLRFRALADPVGAVPQIVRGLEDENPEWQGFAAEMIRTLDGAGVDAAILNMFTTLNEEAQVRFVRAIGRRGHPSAINLATELVTHPSEEMKMAAAEALGTVGTRGSALTLAELAGLSTGDLQRVARENLYRVQRPTARAVEQVMGQAIPRFQSEATRIELIDALRIRGAREQAPVLRQTITEGTPALRIASWRALAVLDSPDSLGLLAREFRAIPEDAQDEKFAAATALSMIAQRAESPDQAAQPIIAQLRSDTSEMDRVWLLSVLGDIGGASALGAIEQALADTSAPQVRERAAMVLATWPDATALPAMERLLSDPATPEAWRSSLVEGSVRLINASIPDFQAANKSARLRQLMDHATSDHERRLVLAGLAAAPHIDSISVAQVSLSEPSLALDAARLMFAVGKVAGERNENAGADMIQQALTTAQATAAQHPGAISPADLDALQTEAGAAVNHVDRRRDFITGWRIAGPYMIEGRGGGDLFDERFPPEDPEADVE